MKVLILSDSHRSFGSVRKAIDANPDISLIIHAGDVQRDVDDICREYPLIPCAYVTGNNEIFSYDEVYDRVFEVAGKRIFLTHGHKYGVKYSLAPLIAAAKKSGADICIFGHTHERYLSNEDILVINPGTARYSYAILTIKNGRAEVEFKNV